MLPMASVLIAHAPEIEAELPIGLLDGKRYSVISVNTGEEALSRARDE